MGRAKDWLRLVRIPFAPTAAADSCACLLLALSAAGTDPRDVPAHAWLLLAATSVLVYAFGMAANDVADRERDRLVAPGRPLPSGRLSTRAACLGLVLLGGGALALGGGPAGERLVVAAALLLAAAYDFAPRRGLVFGALAMGGVRFANASIAVAPHVLSGAVPWTVLLAPAAIGLYSASVTVLSTTEELASRARTVVARWGSAAAFLLAATAAGLASDATPVLGLALAGTVVLNAGLGRSPRPGPAKAQVREMLLGLYFLEAVVGSAAGGASFAWGLGLFLAAFAAILLTQLAMRALARP